MFYIKLVSEYVDEHLPVQERGKNINIGRVDGVEGNVDDPGQYEGGPTKCQQLVTQGSVLSQFSSVAVLVYHGEALFGVQTDDSGHGQNQ